VEFDAGWYGPEGDPRSDARAVARPDLDLEEVIRYGRDKGIGVILYVNRRALERQMDEIFPLYERWGVKGVKFGFVQVGSQEWTAWVNQGVRKAAAHHRSWSGAGGTSPRPTATPGPTAGSLPR
jgi:alpha-glucosidase